jgi:hypothetical protein
MRIDFLLELSTRIRISLSLWLLAALHAHSRFGADICMDFNIDIVMCGCRFWMGVLFCSLWWYILRRVTISKVELKRTLFKNAQELMLSPWHLAASRALPRSYLPG